MHVEINGLKNCRCVSLGWSVYGSTVNEGYDRVWRIAVTYGLPGESRARILYWKFHSCNKSTRLLVEPVSSQLFNLYTRSPKYETGDFRPSHSPSARNLSSQPDNHIPCVCPDSSQYIYLWFWTSDIGHRTPNSASIYINRLYFATHSLRHALPDSKWPVPRASVKSAMKSSVVSPE